MRYLQSVKDEHSLWWESEPALSLVVSYLLRSDQKSMYVRLVFPTAPERAVPFR